VEDYVENRETAHVSTSAQNSSAGCTQVSALVERFCQLQGLFSQLSAAKQI